MRGRPCPWRPLAAAALLAVSGGAAAFDPESFEVTRPGQRVVVGADPDYPPYEFLDASGQPAGYNVDLTRAIAEVMGMQVEFHFGTWSVIREELVRGEVDVLQGLTWSEERARTIDFAPPTAVVHQAIFARIETPPVASLEELPGKRVIVFRGGIMDELLTRRGLGPTLTRTDTPADALRLLASGEGDYVALAALPGAWITRERKLTNVVPVARSVMAERYGFAVKKGNTELLARLEEGLAILKKTGRTEAIHERWLGVLEPRGPPWGQVLRWGALMIVPLLALAGGFALWSWSLRRLVAQRTASLRAHQDQLVQADKMAAIGVLVSGVAHEINNPVGTLLLNLPTLRAAILDALDALDEAGAPPGLTLAGIPYRRMREQLPLVLDDMLAGGRHIKHIVEELKDFARRDDAPPLEPTDLNAVAAAAVRLVGPRLQKATTRFETSLAADLPRARANAHRIEQVVVNLLLNAAEALPGPERAIQLVTRRGAEGQPVLEVRDQGVGIKPDDLPRVKDPFFTTKRESGGTGLGLSVSAGIVQEHGGTLEFTSPPGGGTIATLTLPSAEGSTP